MTNYPKLTDSELIDLISADDERAFKEIYDRYSDLLIIYANKKLKDLEQAKDIVQEVFANLWSNRSSSSVETNLMGYLYRSVLNRVFNVFRNKCLFSIQIDEIQDFLCGGDFADFQIREKDIMKIVQNEIQSLPPRMRQVFEYRYNGYMTNRQIAEQLDLSEHTVKTQIKKSLKVLREKLGKEIHLFCWFL